MLRHLTYHLLRVPSVKLIKVVKPVPEEKGFIMLGLDIPRASAHPEVNDFLSFLRNSQPTAMVLLANFYGIFLNDVPASKRLI